MDKIIKILNDPKKAESLKKRFWAKVLIGTKDECWPWIAKAAHPFGYGRMTAGRGVHLKAHRVSYTLANGEIPQGLGVLHKCDNPKCINPDHLFLGTQQDNMKDCISKGRGANPPIAFGEDHCRTKFNKDKAISIIHDKRPVPIIAKENNVSDNTIYRLKNGTSWKGLWDEIRSKRA